MTFEQITVTSVSGDGEDFRIDCDPRDVGGTDGVDRTVRADTVTINGQTVRTATSVVFTGAGMSVDVDDETNTAAVEL